MFYKRLKDLRKVYRLSQKELGAILHVSKQTVSNWENDNIVPSIEMLLKSADFFHVSTDYLLGLDDRVCLEVTDLSLEQISLIQQIINTMKKS